MAQLTESDYRIAQDGNAKVRQEFLEAVDLEDAKEYVRKVIYIPQNIPQTKFWMGVNPYSPRTIIVGKSAFKDFSFSYFEAVLKKHEGVHVRQFQEKKDIMKRINFRRIFSFFDNSFSWESIVEIPTYYNLLPSSQNFSPVEYASTLGQISSLKYFFNRSYKFDERKKLLEQILLGTPGDELVKEQFLSK